MLLTLLDSESHELYTVDFEEAIKIEVSKFVSLPIFLLVEDEIDIDSRNTDNVLYINIFKPFLDLLLEDTINVNASSISLNLELIEELLIKIADVLVDLIVVQDYIEIPIKTIYYNHSVSSYYFSNAIKTSYSNKPIVSYGSMKVVEEDTLTS